MYCKEDKTNSDSEGQVALSLGLPGRYALTSPCIVVG